MNSEDHFKKLTEKLGVEWKPEKEDAIDAEIVVQNPKTGGYQAIVPTNTQSTAVAIAQPKQPSNRADDEEDDYSKVRGNYTDLASVGAQALNDLLSIARITNEPRAFEVIATLIKSLNETNKNLYGIHEESKKTKELSRLASNPTGIAQGGTTHIEKAVFVGSATDLLEKVKNNEITSSIDQPNAE